MKKLTLTIVALFTLNFLFANDSTFLVYQFNIMEEIAPSVWRQTKKVFAEADSLDADLILIRMNT